MTPPPVPPWLVPWSLWVIGGKVGPRPDAPSQIPDWAVWFPGWVKWRMNGSPQGSRPAKAPLPVPKWVWDPAKEIIRTLRSEESLAFWRRMGVWVTRIDHFPPSWLQAYGAGEYGIVTVPCLMGLGPETNTEGLDEYIAGARAVGYSVVGSQWGQADNTVKAADEARAAVEAVKRYGFDGWCMNGEKIYEGGGKTAAYAREFRRALPMLPFAWSPEARLDLDHGVLQELNVCYQPQAYPLENQRDVAYCAEWGANFGYADENVVPLVGSYPVHGVRYPAALVRQQAIDAGLGAVVMYTGNQTADDPVWWRDLVL